MHLISHLFPYQLCNLSCLDNSGTVDYGNLEWMAHYLYMAGAAWMLYIKALGYVSGGCRCFRDRWANQRHTFFDCKLILPLGFLNPTTVSS